MVPSASNQVEALRLTHSKIGPGVNDQGLPIKR